MERCLKWTQNVIERCTILRDAYQDAFFEAFSRTPMEHAGGVVLHFSLFEIKVFRLVVGDTDLNTVAVYVCANRSSSGRRSLIAYENNKKTTFN